MSSTDFNINNYTWEGKSILIAEDIVSNYNFLRLLLKKSKVNILWVENGRDAVNTVLNDNSIDLVLLDINLPILNGYEVVKKIKQKRPNLPVIAQTAYALGGDREKSMSAGCDDYVSKPISISVLLKKIDAFLSK
ncbi:MAG: response regulator [Bacteroidales bacterium]|jgi:two-component system cell cycle response regulator DivK|nr:response regulator [Bacteroidales bacterium]